MATLEFVLPPEDLPRLFAHPSFRRRGGRTAAVELIWYDTAEGDLTRDHLSLCDAKGLWRLERAQPRPGEAWPPGTPSPLVAESPDRTMLGPLPEPLMPVAGFRGQRRTVRVPGEQEATLVVLEGTLRGMAQEKPSCRIMLDGPAPRLIELSNQLTAIVRLEVPRWSHATEAAAFARGWPPPDRNAGAPEVPPGMTVGDAVALVVGHLTDVILAGVPAASAGETPEPVHAMRVAVRRLRSALSVFRKVTDGPAFQALKPQLHELGAALGRARDWDVFLAGTGQDVAAALPEDRRIAGMIAMAAKKREAGYAALRQTFASPMFRQLTVGLVQFAALRPWQIEADADRAAALTDDASQYASKLLAKRHGHMLEPGPDISGLPAPDLHALRKQGKRLRYTAEFFAPCYGRRSTKRFVRGVSRLQEALGHLNDGAAAAELMGMLRGGPDAHFADGAVQGFAAARSTDAREAIAKSWAKFRRAEPFWD
jgi:CHAD domain-containing protein